MGSGATGSFRSRKVSPSAAVGCAYTAPRSAVYGVRPIMAVWTAAISSLASAPNAVNPRMWSLSAATSIFRNPRGSDRVRVRRTAAIGMVSSR